MGQERELGITLPRRNRAEEAAGVRISGEEFRSLRWGFERRSKRERERSAGAFYRRGQGGRNGRY
jgi:hypothetical protein